MRAMVRPRKILAPRNAVLDGWLRYWSSRRSDVCLESDCISIVRQMLTGDLMPQWSAGMSVWDRVYFLSSLYEKSRFGEARRTHKRDTGSYFTPRAVAERLIEDLDLGQVLSAFDGQDEIIVLDVCAGVGNLAFALLQKLATELTVQKVTLRAVEADQNNFAVLRILLGHCAADLPFVIDLSGLVCGDVLQMADGAGRDFCSGADIVLCNPPWANFVPSKRRDMRQSNQAAAGLSPRALKGFVSVEVDVGLRSDLDISSRGYGGFVELCLDAVALRKHENVRERNIGLWALILPAAFFKDLSLADLRCRIFLDEQAGGLIARVIRNADESFAMHPDFEYLLLSGGGNRKKYFVLLNDECQEGRLDLDRSLLERVGGPIALVPSGLDAEWQVELMEKLWSGERLGDALQSGILGWRRQFDLSQMHDAVDADGRPAIVLNESGDTALEVDFRYLPVLDGRMVDVFGLSQKSYVSGYGRSGVWQNIADDISHDFVRKSQFLMSRAVFESKSQIWSDDCSGAMRLYVAYCAVSGKQNSRLVKACLTGDLPHSSAVPVFFELNTDHQGVRLLLLLGLLNSSLFDFALRRVLSGNNLNKYLLELMPVPAEYFDLNLDVGRKMRIVALVARLTLFGADADFRLGGLRAGLINKLLRFCDQSIWQESVNLTEAQSIFDLDKLVAEIFGADGILYESVLENARHRGFFRVSGRRIES
jgi:hypothetical protein